MTATAPPETQGIETKSAVTTLTRYRAALMVQVFTVVVLLTTAPVWIVTYRLQDPTTTFSMVGTMLAWWGAFIATCAYHERL